MSHSVLPVIAGALVAATPVGATAQPGEFIVRFHEPPTVHTLDAIGARVPGVHWRALSRVARDDRDGAQVHPLDYVRLACSDQSAVPIVIMEQLATLPQVARVEPNHPVRLAADTKGDASQRRGPNDPLYPAQWPHRVMRVAEAWEVTRGHGEVIVAVLDSGLTYEHEEFRGDTIWVNENEVPDNGLDDDSNGLVDDYRGWDFFWEDNHPEDVANHGTAVAGIIGATTNNGRGVAGLAQVRLMIVGAHGFAADLIEATYYAVDMGAHVVNYSLVLGEYVEEFELAVDYAMEQDVLLVAAAGNDGRDVTRYPARFESVMAVSATTVDDTVWEESNFGDWIDVAAPGALNVPACDADDVRGYRSFGGTSSACPHTSGLAALVRSAAPQMSARRVRSFLRRGATDLGDAGFDPFYGHGRVNAATTMQLVARDTACPGDFDHDNAVGFEDVLTLLGRIGGIDWTVDIVDDGRIDFLDLITLLGNWGPCGA